MAARHHLRGLILTLPVFAVVGCKSPTNPAPAAPANRAPGNVTVSASADRGLQAATEFAFAAQAVDADGDPLTYTWDFGDATTGTGATPKHVYQTSGTFTAKVVVSDGQASTSAQTAVTVKDLSGTWARGIDDTGCSYSWTLTLTQTGSTLAGTLGLVGTSGCAGMAFGNPGPITGSVAPGEQPVAWTGILGGPPPTKFAARVNPDVTVLSGITLCTPRTAPLPDTCSTGAWVGDPLTRR